MASASRIRRLFGDHRIAQARQHRGRRRALLQLEPLERRALMSGITYQVNTFNDTLDFGLAQGTDQNGQISLRSAIEAANYDEGEYLGQVSSITIDLPAGTYDLSLGELALIPDGIPVTIVGQGSTQSIIDAQMQSRVMEIEQGIAATPIMLQNVVLENGVATDSGVTTSIEAEGAGILDNTNPLSLQNVTLTSNRVLGETSDYPSAWGGAIYAFDAALSITDCTITDNVAQSLVDGQTIGGGIYDDEGNLTLTNSTVDSNSATGGNGALGGGIYSIGANDSISGSQIEGNGAYAGLAPVNVAGDSAQGGGLFFGSGPIPYPPPAVGNSLTIQNSQISGNLADGGGGGYGANAILHGVTVPVTSNEPPQPGQPGGGAYGAGVYVEGGQAHLTVTITNSSVNGNSATGGIGGAGGGGRYAATGATGGNGGPVYGAGISMNDPGATLTIMNSTISQNGASGGTGGAGGNENVPANVPSPPAAAPGGNGGLGGTVEGGGALIDAGVVTVTDTTFESNAATGGAGGVGGLGVSGVDSSGASGGNGGNGGSGGAVFGAALYVPAATSNPTTDTFAALTIQNNSTNGGAGGAGAAGSSGGNFSTAGAMAILEDVSYVPVFGVLADVGMIALDAVRQTSTTPGAAGGDGGFGGAGGSVGAAFVIGGGTTQINGTAIVQNASQAGAGGDGGNGGNGGNNDSGPGGDAGNGGAAGIGGFAYGGGLEVYGGTVTVLDTTIDSNATTAGMGGGFGLPGTPGDQETVAFSDYFFPALNVAMAITGYEIGGTAEEVFSATWDITKLAGKTAAYFTTSQFAYPEFGYVTPYVTGADDQTATVAVSGVAGGGGIYADGGTLNLISDTITRNSSDIAGGVYISPGSTVNIGNTIIAQNTAQALKPIFMLPV